MRITEKDWQDLEAERHARGIVSKRLYPSSQHDLFIAVDQLTGQRMLAVRTGPQDAATALRRLRSLPDTRGLQVQFNALADGQRELRIQLVTDELRTVFNPLVTDIAATAQTAPDAPGALVSAVQRFEHWRSLLQSIGEHGLSPELRRGLYGELLVLRNHLLAALPSAEALRSWTGPKFANQDYQLENCAIEVKTNSTRQPQTIQIASERQLDDTAVNHLILVALSVDERQGGSGESLNVAVDAVRRALVDADLGSQFDDLVIRAGYFSHQRHLYDEPRYTLRSESLWRVSDDFPRITEKELRAGVGDCHYRITTSGLAQYEITHEQLAAVLRGVDG